MASHGVPRGPRTRTDEQKRIDADKIQKYHELEAKIKQSSSFDATVYDYTTRLLRLNPEYYTVWNVRRRCLTTSLLSPVSGTDDDDAADARRAADFAILQGELHYTIPLLLEFPKCYWIWSYRLWVLQQAVQRLDAPRASRLWHDELALDSKMLTKDRRNFHAWGYRRQVVAQLEVLDGARMVEAEFEFTTKMVHRDLSNFSAWHNRSTLIPVLLAERGATDAERTAFLESELSLVRDALNVGPEDQSLWFYHQFLMLGLTGGAGAGHATIAPHLTRAERTAYIAGELDGLRELLEDYDDVKWLYEALLEYTLAAARMDGERPLKPGEAADVQAWLDKLRVLDPKRSGRWDDIEKDIRGLPTK